MDSLGLSVCIASCLIHPSREEYLNKCISSIKKDFPNAEFLVAFDKVGKEIPGCKTYVHQKGLGHSWNWGMQEAKHSLILQTEDDWVTEAEFLGHGYGELAAKVMRAKTMSSQDPLLITRLDNVTNADMAKWYYPGWREVMKVNDYQERTFVEMNKCSLPDIFRGFNQYFYTNRPHFKMRKFHELVGWYPEEVSVPRVELDYGRHVIATQGTRVVAYNHNSFVHVGSVQVRQTA
jgi:hypothetical protein